MNFVFISPHFPSHFWRFCAALNQRGVKVLGIADTAYENLLPELQGNLTDYYQVGSLEDGEAVLRAIGYFISRHGRIDWIESNNEYWLAQDAWLRTMFNVTTGPQIQHMDMYKLKSEMKKVYEKAGIKSAPCLIADSLDDALKFAKQVKYPLIAKPNVGVGANDTFRVHDEKELCAFFAKLPLTPYLLEKYVEGEVCSYDSLIGSKGQPLYETGNITTTNIMDVVNEKNESVYMIVPQLADDLVALGRKAVKAFKVKSRLIHFEFFRLTKDQEGLGKKGDLLGLEVNLRPSGGFTPDMINYAGSVDIHALYADMVCHDQIFLNPDRKTYFCVFAGRQDTRTYANSYYDLMRDWGHRIVFHDRMPEALSGAMGNEIFLAKCINRDEVDAFVKYACERLE